MWGLISKRKKNIVVKLVIFNGHIWDKRKLIAYLRLVDPDCQFWSVMIRILLLPEGN